jgi:hypothetical protein
MTSVLIISSAALEVGLVIATGVIFLAMIVAVLALIIWSIAGIRSVTHP